MLVTAPVMKASEEVVSGRREPQTCLEQCVWSDHKRDFGEVRNTYFEKVNCQTKTEWSGNGWDTVGEMSQKECGANHLSFVRKMEGLRGGRNGTSKTTCGNHKNKVEKEDLIVLDRDKVIQYIREWERHEMSVHCQRELVMWTNRSSKS